MVWNNLEAGSTSVNLGSLNLTREGGWKIGVGFLLFLLLINSVD